jgi:hypothetical protein
MRFVDLPFLSLFFKSKQMATTKKLYEEKKLSNTIESLFGLPKMARPYATDLPPLEEYACPGLFYGVELEIENVPNYGDWNYPPGISFKEDNSLRNNGIEVVTAPMRPKDLDYTLRSLFEAAKLDEENYSERCSVHVHANCRDLTLDQLSVIALLYQIFEHLFYRFIGDGRDTNIFCVPWYETTLTHGVINNFNINSAGKLKRWQKYTGLNLLPLFGFGTIEFRHMAGTNNRRRIMNWCNLIGCLFQYALTHELKQVKDTVVGLNTTSAYRQTIDEVFGRWSDLLKSPNYEPLLEEGVLSMKYSLLDPVDDPGFDWVLADAIRRDREVNVRVNRQPLPPQFFAAQPEQALQVHDDVFGGEPEAVRRPVVRPLQGRF